MYTRIMSPGPGSRRRAVVVASAAVTQAGRQGHHGRLSNNQYVSFGGFCARW